MGNKLIEPRKIQGFWELTPKEEALFENMLSSLRAVFENNCFLPLDTPVAEFSEVLLAKSGGDVDKEIYRFTKGHADICLRYDLTVPLARFVAGNYNLLDFPFKRYQIGKVYRGERPQKGRFREFYQCDADIIGEELSLTYDAECIYLYKPCFKALNLDVEVEISNRKLLSGLFAGLNYSGDTADLFTIVDKFDKLSREDFVEELLSKGISETDLDAVMRFVSTKGGIEEVKNWTNLVPNAEFYDGIKELEALDLRLKALGMENYHYNLSIVRGHNYYTGTVFECYIKGKRNLGAVGGGGRYDNLCKNFMDKNLQGVGMSIGITRLFDILKSENLLSAEENVGVKLGIVTFEETLKEGLTLMAKLRESGIKADLINETKSFKAKMKEANKRNIPFLLVLGEDEVKSEKYTLKDMQTGSQVACTFEELVKGLS